jgi:hypothetical protein
MKHEPCLICPHVASVQRPVRVLIHHHDGTWQAACGERDHAVDCGDFAILALSLVFERQADVRGLDQLPVEHIAQWSDGRWEVVPFDEGAA